MKNLKKPDLKTIFRLTYIGLGLASLLIFYLLFAFLQKNLKEAAQPATAIQTMPEKTQEEINIQQFETIIKALAKKKNR